MQPAIHPETTLMLCGSIYLAYNSWSNVASIVTSRSQIDACVQACCTAVLQATPACLEEVVRTWGAGVTVSSISDLCQATLPAAKSALTPELIISIATGILGTIIGCAAIGVAGKTIYDIIKRNQNQYQLVQ